jgi:chromosomal replication initiator protein
MSRMRAILAEVSAERRIPTSDLLSPSRQHPIAHARQEAMVRMYATGRLSLTQIGNFFDRDHTTVLYGIRQVQKRAGA